MNVANVELTEEAFTTFIKALQYISQRECRVDFARPCMHEDSPIDEPCESCCARLVLSKFGIHTFPEGGR